MTWLQPAVCSMLAINFAVMGALDLSFLSWRAYGKFGMTAVILRADAVLQALIMMRSSMSASLMSPGGVDCRMNTRPYQRLRSWVWRRLNVYKAVLTILVADRLADGNGCLLVRVL
jgi:hypothetical protein